MSAKKLPRILAAIASACLIAHVPPALASGSIKILYSFSGSPDGQNPTGTLITDASGNLYGTTFAGGDKNSDGTVFELSPASDGSWVETILHRFTGGQDGGRPFAGLVMDKQGNLYGAAGDGGLQYCPEGCGTVFELSPSLGGGWKFKLLHRFTGPDGATPYPGLTIDSSGNLFGATQSGGSYNVGVIYELSALPNGGFTFSLIHDFRDGADGAEPNALTLGPNGSLYGGTSGSLLPGTVFELSPTDQGKWNFDLIYTFQAPLLGPSGPMVFDSAGNLYGVTYGGGSQSEGTAFKLSPAANGSWTGTLLYSFPGSAGGTNPAGPLIIDPEGNLYGTTQFGYVYDGSVFKLTPDSSGGWKASTLQVFKGPNGVNAQGGVLRDAAGNLYGVTQYGGPLGEYGVVYELTH